MYPKKERSLQLQWATTSQQSTVASTRRYVWAITRYDPPSYRGQYKMQYQCATRCFTAINKHLEPLPATMSGRSVAANLRIWTLALYPATLLLSGPLLSLRVISLPFHRPA
ncbi:hypothetical protein HYPSUDRAFT_1055034 [Hypholoma sublateritium FD-334 SS-4]|uniref:Uncharacterized protein n=1 Tax=Hypholoma sublateritium (strain FD-334 SS-4) TaxID=945553 RepID=A0A0D2NCM1_HYPSF|nr:hypothetical protein HYPSUDRAFT_1055034 [Hypholoma sublateritium FD-334 SS-4]